MFRLLAASLLLTLCSFASHAAQTTYEWTIDWQNRPDQSGTLVFDDGGDASARTVRWDVVYGAPVPAGISGLPPGAAASGSLAFDGSFVSGLSGCSDPYNACTTPTTRFGFTQTSFSLLSPTGSAIDYSYNYTGSDVTSPCLQTNLLAIMPDSCFAIDRGVTTFDVLAAPVPEASTWMLLLAGLAGLALHRRRPALRTAAVH
jgi:PEP-CTERM motif